jgi:hypothetical protein
MPHASFPTGVATMSERSRLEALAGVASSMAGRPGPRFAEPTQEARHCLADLPSQVTQPTLLLERDGPLRPRQVTQGRDPRLQPEAGATSSPEVAPVLVAAGNPRTEHGIETSAPAGVSPSASRPVNDTSSQSPTGSDGVEEQHPSPSSGTAGGGGGKSRSSPVETEDWESDEEVGCGWSRYDESEEHGLVPVPIRTRLTRRPQEFVDEVDDGQAPGGVEPGADARVTQAPAGGSEASAALGRGSDARLMELSEDERRLMDAADDTSSQAPEELGAGGGSGQEHASPNGAGEQHNASDAGRREESAQREDDHDDIEEHQEGGDDEDGENGEKRGGGEDAGDEEEEDDEDDEETESEEEEEEEEEVDMQDDALIDQVRTRP